MNEQVTVEQVNTIVATWEAIPFTVRVLIIAFIAVVMLTEMGKRVLLADIEPKHKKDRFIWGLSFILGALVAISGYMVTDTMPNWFWLFVGATAGTVTNVIHYLVVKVWWKNRVEKKQGGRVVSKADVMKMPKPEGKPDAETEFYVKDNRE
jgi:CDP-diglyceride synthetase